MPQRIGVVHRDIGDFRGLTAKSLRINTGITFKIVRTGFIFFGFITLLHSKGTIAFIGIDTAQRIVFCSAFFFAVVYPADKSPRAFKRG